MPPNPSRIDALVQHPRNIEAVNNAIVARVLSEHGLTVLPQRPAAVRTALLNEWLYWNDERGNMPAAGAPQTPREIVLYINDRTIVTAAKAVAGAYRARQQFLVDQQAPLQVMDRPQFESMAGLNPGENRDIGIA